jgi:hypothetical protein
MRPACRVLLAVAVAVLVLPAGALGSGGPGDPQFGNGKYPLESRTFAGCQRFAATLPFYRTCIADQAYLLVAHTNDPANELPRIDAYVHSVGGWLQANCHVLMHTVGRRYGTHEHVTLTNLLDYLPKTNDPGCSAGFAHGMLIALGPQIQKLGPRGAAADCHRATTRYQRYSCIHGLGHAYARQFNDFIDPALASCGQLGPDDSLDCAQGVFHDYWIAVAGLDGTRRPAGTVTAPRKLCAAQPARYVRVCWYRALLERPPSRTPSSPADLLALCRGLTALQLSGCLTGASLIRSDDPLEQLHTCAGLAGTDGADCLRGLRVQTYALAPFPTKLRLIRACANVRSFQHACYQWLGKTLNVITDGAFETRGCSRLRYAAARASCAEGARSYERALETFS